MAEAPSQRPAALPVLCKAAPARGRTSSRQKRNKHCLHACLFTGFSVYATQTANNDFFAKKKAKTSSSYEPEYRADLMKKRVSEMQFLDLRVRALKPGRKFYGNSRCCSPCDARFLSCFSSVWQVFLRNPNARENVSRHVSTVCGDAWAALTQCRKGPPADTATQQHQRSPGALHCCRAFKLLFPSLSPFGASPQVD